MDGPRGVWSRCRYCGEPADETLDRPLCRPCRDLLEMHRTEQGVDTCPDCDRRHVAVYRCTGCEERFQVSGVFRWSWQGHGHFHDEDDKDGWHAITSDHYQRHGGRSAILPVPISALGGRHSS